MKFSERNEIDARYTRKSLIMSVSWYLSSMEQRPCLSNGRNGLILVVNVIEYLRGETGLILRVGNAGNRSKLLQIVKYFLDNVLHSFHTNFTKEKYTITKGGKKHEQKSRENRYGEKKFSDAIVYIESMCCYRTDIQYQE